MNTKTHRNIGTKKQMNLIPEGSLRGRLHTVTDIRRFIEAGAATITLVSKKTRARFTYKLTRPDSEPGKPRPIWVYVLIGPDNEADYRYYGCIWPQRSTTQVVGSSKSRIGDDAPSAIAFQWFLSKLYGNAEQQAFLLTWAEIWHEGRCCCCNRKLTVPESVRKGIGPECEKNYH